ncbi:unnamed protein product [Rotaria sp. Silwood2]|nr:unnamed protein product [Rotaria sp. Silwood2]
MKFELLPNEIFVECFQYLNAPDIFNSFDRLNYHFHTLIRNSPLHLNFQQFKKSLFNEFCQTILTNPEIKQNIISLQLSNESTCGQIQSFLSLISLNEFIHLRSLSLIDINDENDEQLLSMLSLLSNLDCFSCTCSEYKTLKIISVLTKSKIRMLTVPQFNFNSTSVYKTMSITSLTISNCDLSDLCQLFKYTPMLKYLKCEHFYNSQITDDELNFTNTNIVYLQKLIIDSSSAKFQVLELLLKRISNLKIFSIFAPNVLELIDANRWQHLIESSLPYLHTFNFNFGYYAHHSYNEKLIKFQQFQTDFWHKQHHWYTNYEIEGFTALIYTLPYVWNEYTLTSTMNRYNNSLISYSNEFDNVKNLFLCTKAIKNNSPCFFRNIQSLILINECDFYGVVDKYKLQVKQIEYLNMIVNVSSIKHLKIAGECYVTSSILLEILKNIPNISSLTTDKQILITFLDNQQLCEYLNMKIKRLDISIDWSDSYIQSNKIDFFCKIFSNLEQLQCYIENLDDLLLILTKCSKLSMIKILKINKQIYTWIQNNAPILNVYIDFTLDDYESDDDMENI